MTWYCTLNYGSYEDASEQFTWDIPEKYNCAWDLIGKHENPKDKIALYHVDTNSVNGACETYTFHSLDVISNRMARGLRALGIDYGDRVAVMVPQKPETLLTQLACWKLGAVTVPLSVLYGEEAIEYRLRHSNAGAIIVDAASRDVVGAVRTDCPALEYVIEVDGDASGDARTFESIPRGSKRFDIAETDADTPAMILYTSGTTGPPKGVVHTHDVFVGFYPTHYMYCELGVTGNVYWTPGEWAWLGSLGHTVAPPLHYGRPIVSHPMSAFDAERSYEIIEEYGVTTAMIVPTGLKMLREAIEAPTDRYDLDLDVIVTAGEPLPPDVLHWVEDDLEGIVLNEMYGTTEVSAVVSNCRTWFDLRPGSTGKAAPGHNVRVIDPETGMEKPRTEIGAIAVHKDRPGLFDRYLHDPEETDAIRVDDWILTGDLGQLDEDGYLWFEARADDVIITSGYRVGPYEIENILDNHEAVMDSGVIGVPDDIRSERVKAFVELVDGVEPSEALRHELREMVRDDLAKYKYPREIEFVDKLPRTVTGKVQRATLAQWHKDIGS